MPVKQELHAGAAPVKIWTDELDAPSREQLENVSRLPFVWPHVAAMPDVHLGIGATVGSVIPTRGAIVPAAVGVDLGCGMCAQRITLSGKDLDEKCLKRVFDQIYRDVPVGFAQHAAARAPVDAARPFGAGLARILDQHPALAQKIGRGEKWIAQLGTLGGGNHFIEVCLDEENRVWVMLHSGSRGAGNAIGTYFIELARRELERQDVHLPDRNLAYLSEGTRHFEDYIEAVSWAQAYARANRACMMAAILAALRRHLPPFTTAERVVDCHHNYVERERHFGELLWITRKGAIRAGAGDLGIIPGSMGAKSYIVRGKGSLDAFDSCAHGAGRLLSRRAAKKQFSAEELARQTEGVICRKDRGVVDEIPAAYKPIDEVMANQSDLVEVVHTLKQVICVKG